MRNVAGKNIPWEVHAMAVSAARADLRPAAIDWDGLDALKYVDEREAARRIDALVGLDAAARAGVGKAAVGLVEHARKARRSAGLMESFLQEFGLSNKEGLALM